MGVEEMGSRRSGTTRSRCSLLQESEEVFEDMWSLFGGGLHQWLDCKW